MKITPHHKFVLSSLIKEYVKPNLGIISLAFLCMVMSALALAATTKLIKPVVDDILVNKNALKLLPISLSFLTVFIIKGLCDYGESIFLTKFGQSVVTDLQVRCFKNIIKADIEFFHANSTGELVSRLTNDVSQLRYVVSSVLINIGKDFITVISLLAVMFIHDPELASFAIIAFPLAVIPALRIGRKVRKIATSTQNEIGTWSGFLTQCFQGIKLIKAYGMEDYELKQANSIANKVFHFTLKATRMKSINHPLMEALGGIAISFIIMIGGWYVINGNRSAGELFTFLGALAISYQPIKSLANLNANLQEGLAAAQRLYALLQIKPQIINKKNAGILNKPRGEIKFCNIDFIYPNGFQALYAVSFSIQPGKKVALVGPSGSGKSTLISLIQRFYDPSKGRIFIDQTDISTVTIDSLRKAISVVSQEITLFDDTVLANISYGKPDANMDEIISVSKSAAAYDFIQELPEGFNTIVGENGVNLSAGQRQRLSIARAMLKNAPILLLDEATSSLDTESERQVQDAFNMLTSGRTTLIIAHRLSTVLDADCIVVLDQGKIIESGTHDELLENKGTYFKLYAAQAI